MSYIEEALAKARELAKKASVPPRRGEGEEGREELRRREEKVRGALLGEAPAALVAARAREKERGINYSAPHMQAQV